MREYVEPEASSRVFAKMRVLHLHHADDSEAGITRRATGRGFAYYDSNGRLIRDKNEKARIKALAIPPAWSDVWISPHPRGHIQATGRDAKGRKQYIYHMGFRAWRESAKFEHVVDFALSLPQLRRQVEEDLTARKLDEKLVLATAVRILERTLMRVGNVAYLTRTGPTA